MTTLAKIDRLQQALDKATTIEEVATIRTQVEVIAKTLAPRHVADRFNASAGYVVACCKHGEFWNNLPNKRPQGQNLSSKLIYMTVDVASAGFKNAMDAHQCAGVARLNPQDLEIYLDECEGNGKYPTLGGAYKVYRMLNDFPIETPNLPDGIYSVIYADPPWKYDNLGLDVGWEYPTMELEEICDLKISKMSMDESVLFLWATNPLLPEALQVLRTWGFEYKTNIAWMKDRGRGLGWFLRSRHELLLIGVKENTPKPEYKPDSAFTAKRPKRHSEKPTRAYEIIERMYPGSKKIELFSRQERDGWDSWGLDISNGKA